MTYSSLHREDDFSEPKYIPGHYGMVDVELLVETNDDELSAYNAQKKKILDEFNALPENIEAIKQHKKTLVKTHEDEQELCRRDIARAIDSMVDRNCIFGDYQVLFDDGELATASFLAGPGGKERDGDTAHDPLDPSPKNKGKSIFYWNDGVNPYLSSKKHGGYGLRVYAEEPLSSNEWMNRHHAQVFKGEGLLYAVDKKDFGSVGPLDERIIFVTEAALKKLYEGRNAYDSKGKVITNDK